MLRSTTRSAKSDQKLKNCARNVSWKRHHFAVKMGRGTGLVVEGVGCDCWDGGCGGD